MIITKLNMARLAFLLFIVLILIVLAINSSVRVWTIAALVAVFLLFLVRWHAGRSSYVCPDCQHSFKISAWIDFISPHVPGMKWLRCPLCSSECWCRCVVQRQVG